MFRLLVPLGLLSCAATAHAQPCAPVTIVGCEPELEVDALTRALTAEGVRCDVTLTCTDGALRVEWDGGEATHDVGAIPPAVRARIVALLVSEAVRGEPLDASSGEAEPAAPPAVESSDPDAPSATLESARAADAASTSRSDEGSAPRSAGDAGAEDAPPSSRAPTTDGRRRRAHPGALAIVDDGPDDSADVERPGVLLGVGALLRTFVDPVTAVVGPVASLAVEALRVEVGYGFGRAVDALGAALLSLGHVSAGANVVCAHLADVALCAGALATVGYARVDPEQSGAGARAAEGVYAGGALELSGRVSTDALSVTLELRGGWGYGLVAEAGDRELAALGGGWAGARLGVDLGVY